MQRKEIREGKGRRKKREREKGVAISGKADFTAGETVRVKEG